MKKIKIILLIFFIFFLFEFLISCKSEKLEDKTTLVSSEDKEMNDAITIARSRLNEFWALYDNPKNGETGFALKVKITDNNGIEHFWCSDILRKDGKISGIINNDPEIVKSVKLMDEILINEKDISDWLYIKDNKMYGNYTLRAMFKFMSKKELSDVKELLSDEP